MLYPLLSRNTDSARDLTVGGHWLDKNAEKVTLNDKVISEEVVRKVWDWTQERIKM
jgi:hypothetical protein